MPETEHISKHLHFLGFVVPNIWQPPVNSTPLKINDWNLENHPIEKESHLPNIDFGEPQPLICQGVPSQKLR